jgi:hypothetical protein
VIEVEVPDAHDADSMDLTMLLVVFGRVYRRHSTMARGMLRNYHPPSEGIMFFLTEGMEVC